TFRSIKTASGVMFARSRVTTIDDGTSPSWSKRRSHTLRDDRSRLLPGEVHQGQSLRPLPGVGHYGRVPQWILRSESAGEIDGREWMQEDHL
ncbi:hypothetical protein PMAYCL1PPCAC_09891, partial [Pristionchus mayeri]